MAKRHGPKPKPYVDYVRQREDERAIERMLYEIRFQSDFAFLTEPVKARHHYGKSLSEPGRICSTTYCRTYVAGAKSTPCPDCGSTK